MKRFAVILGNIVSNIIVAETKEDAESVVSNCVEITEDIETSIGWTYDVETKLFSAPVVEESVIE